MTILNEIISIARHRELDKTDKETFGLLNMLADRDALLKLPQKHHRSQSLILSGVTERESLKTIARARSPAVTEPPQTITRVRSPAVTEPPPDHNDRNSPTRRNTI